MLDLFQFNEIYNDQFNYFVEQNQVKQWLVGEGFDNDEYYSSVDQENLHLDLVGLSSDVIPHQLISRKRTKFTKNKHILITAGAPGAGKTCLLKSELAKRKAKDDHYCYVCPDDVCLKNMSATFCSMRSFLNASTPDEALSNAKRCYYKWRPASNAAAHLLLAHLLKGGFPIAFGTTSTSERTPKSFSFIKSLGYKIELFFVVAPDPVRYASIENRNRRFYQSTDKDVLEKAYFLMDRLKDSFIPYADVIHFYWREHWDQEPILAASWKRDGPLRSYESGVDFLLDESEVKVLHRACYDALLKQCILKDNEYRKEKAASLP